MIYRLLAIGAALGISSAAWGQSAQTHHPKYDSAIRAELLLVGSTRAGEGFGVEAHYDLLVAEGGPGRLLLGPNVYFVFADEQATRSGCIVNEDEQILGVLGSLRYVLDIHPRVRPWGRLGLGVMYVDYETQEEDPCILDFEDFTDTGPNIALGIGLDIDVSDNVLVSIAADAHNGEEEFATLNVGVGWRF